MKTRSRTLSKKITEIFEEIDQAKIELNSFQSLNISEKNAIPRRIEVPYYLYIVFCNLLCDIINFFIINI